MRVPRPSAFRTVAIIGVAAAVTAGLVGPATAAPAKPADSRGGPAAIRPVLRGIDLESADDPRPPAGHGPAQADLGPADLLLPAADRRAQPQVARRDHDQPDALRIARASDKQRRHSGARSPLEGIPVLLKDNIDTARPEPTTAGSFALLGSTPARDAFLVQRLRAAGAVMLGKANLSEWANFRSTASSSGWSGVGGQTNNPYVLDRNPCGSSSGSARPSAADLAHGGDRHRDRRLDRLPVRPNGVVGIKPTLGLVSRSGIVPISAEQDTAGPMATHVADAALTCPCWPAPTRGSGDRRVRAVPHVNYLAGFGPNALRGKRIGLWLAGTGWKNVPAVAQIMADTPRP